MPACLVKSVPVGRFRHACNPYDLAKRASTLWFHGVSTSGFGQSLPLLVITFQTLGMNTVEHDAKVDPAGLALGVGATRQG
jgi:hypothetical protein